MYNYCNLYTSGHGVLSFAFFFHFVKFLRKITLIIIRERDEVIIYWFVVVYHLLYMVEVVIYKFECVGSFLVCNVDVMFEFFFCFVKKILYSFSLKIVNSLSRKSIQSVKSVRILFSNRKKKHLFFPNTT